MTSIIRASIHEVNCQLRDRGDFYRAFNDIGIFPNDFPFRVERTDKYGWEWDIPKDCSDIIFYHDERIPRTWGPHEQLQWFAKYKNMRVEAWAFIKEKQAFVAWSRDVVLESPLFLEQRQLGHAWYEGYIPKDDQIEWEIPARLIGTYKGYFAFGSNFSCEEDEACIVISTGHVNDHIPDGILIDQMYIGGKSRAWGKVHWADPDFKIDYLSEKSNKSSDPT